MSPGFAFYADWISGATPHIYFVAYQSSAPHPLVVLFNFTTHRPGTGDETCIITPTEYAALRHDSVVAYRHGEILEGLALDHMRTSGLSRKLPERISPEVLLKIQRGAMKSRHTPLKIKTILSESLNLAPEP